MTKLALILLPVMAWIVAPVLGFSNGAPISSCLSMMPKHHTAAQTSISPYVVRVSATSYNPGDVIQVTLTSLTGTSEFTGFIVRAGRVSGDKEELVGGFINFDASQVNGFPFYPEEEGDKNCVTQVSNETKTSVTFGWKASKNLGDVIIRASFVEKYDKFWVGVQSDTIQATVKVPVEEFSAEPEVFSHPSTEMRAMTEGCGDSKGCFLYPMFCGSVKCDYAASFSQVDEHNIKIEMFGKSDGYVSLGFSHDKLMGDDIVFTCSVKDEVAGIQFGYNPAYYYMRHRAVDLSNVRVSNEDGFIYCSFVAPKTVTFQNARYKKDSYGKNIVPKEYIFEDKSYSLDADSYLMIAVGGVYDQTESVPKMHVLLPVVSSKPVNVFAEDPVTVYATGISVYIKAHAILGLLGWYFLAISGMIVARHFRWELNQVCCGSFVWFQLHRFVMFSVFLLSVAAIAVVFYSTGKFTETAVTHAIFGLITASLSFLQILGTLCRPDGKHKRRPVFNGLHKFGAFLIYMVAGATMILAPFSTSIHPLLRYRLLAIIIAGLIIYGIWELSFEIMRYCICTYRDEETQKQHTERVNAVKAVWFFAFFIISIILMVLAIYFIVIA